jgi:uncharacterized protein (UPF0335 family)
MMQPLVHIPKDQTVDSLILEDVKDLYVELGCTIFDGDTINKVLQLHISRHGGADHMS